MDDMQEETNEELGNEPDQGSEPVPQYSTTFERGDEVELAETLIQSLGPDIIYDEGDFYRYDETVGIWKLLSSASLTASLSRFAGSPVIGPRHILQLSYSKISGALKIARAQRMGVDSSFGFANAATGVAFRNGFVSVYDGQVYLDPHRQGHMARHSYPFDYIPNEPCPMLEEFFAQIFAEDEPEERVQQVSLLQEFIGISLIGEATRYQRNLFLVGNGANGKSAFLEIAESVFPPHSVASVPPQDWGKQFSIASLVGCLANLVNEIPENEIVCNAVFKSVISGEPIRGEKKFQEPFKFRPRAGHVFSANSLPATNDQSDGFWRRILIVPFERNMELSPVHRRGIAKEIIRTEHSAIIGWALQGAARVQRQGGYTESASSKRLVAQWRQDTDTVRLFLETECVAEPTTSTSATILYQKYRIWAADCGFRPVSLTGFGRRAKQAGFTSKHTHIGNLYQLRPLLRKNG